MNGERPDRPTPAYIRTVFHLGLFGLLCLLFARAHRSTDTRILGLKTLLAVVLPYYPAIWASRIRSRAIVAALILGVVAASAYLVYLEANPGG